MPYVLWFLSPSAVILIIEVQYLSFGSVDPECNAPVARDGEALCPLPVAAQLVNFPDRNVLELLRVFHLLEEGHDVADLLNDWRREAGGIITLDESAQSPMDYVPNLHMKY